MHLLISFKLFAYMICEVLRTAIPRLFYFFLVFLLVFRLPCQRLICRIRGFNKSSGVEWDLKILLIFRFIWNDCCSQQTIIIYCLVRTRAESKLYKKKNVQCGLLGPFGKVLCSRANYIQYIIYFNYYGLICTLVYIIRNTKNVEKYNHYTIV